MAATPSRSLPALALCLNALVWGTSWWPLRHFETLGLHPLWTTALVYAAVVIVIVLMRPRAVMQVLRAPALWLLVLAAGTMALIYYWHKNNLVTYKDELDHLLAIARSDKH